MYNVFLTNHVLCKKETSDTTAIPLGQHRLLYVVNWFTGELAYITITNFYLQTLHFALGCFYQQYIIVHCYLSF